MGYDALSFQPPRLLTTADLALTEATFHLKFSREGWAACSILTTRAEISDTATVRLLREISPPHDFARAFDGSYAVPLGYAIGSRLVTSFREFLSDPQPDDRWLNLVHFEPLGFSVYGRWTPDESEFLVQDSRASIANTVLSLPRSLAPEWLDTLDRLAATVPVDFT